MIQTNDKGALRKKIFQACIEKQQSLIDDFKSRIKAIRETQQTGNEGTYDSKEIAQNSQASAEADALTKEMLLAQEEMQLLQYLKSTGSNSYKTVAPGAIVITEKGNFFISVSIEQFVADHQTFVGISTQSPLYQVMEGLPEGSLFLHNGVMTRITTIL